MRELDYVNRVHRAMNLMNEAMANWSRSVGGCMLCRGRTRTCLSCHGAAWNRLHTGDLGSPPKCTSSGSSEGVCGG